MKILWKDYKQLAQILKKLIKMVNIQQNISLKKYTTWQIGGPAKYFVKVRSLDELKQAVQYAKENKLEIFVLGGGSNILISDEGFNGLVIQIKNEKLKIKNEFIEVASGLNLTKFIKDALAKDYFGMQNLAGIPGSVGGAVRGNAGAYGSQISDFIESVTVFDIKSLEVKELNNKECNFTYRSSIFKTNSNLIIWSIKFNLQKGNTQQAEKIIKQNLEKRKNSQPAYPSTGCVFKNLKQAQFDEFIKNNPNEELPASFLKNKAIATAWLIDRLGLKGTTIGGAEVSPVHANFIINKNNASAQDIITLISLIKTKIRNKFNIQLQEEIQLVGF